MREKRRLQADDRGVSEVIGAILVFGLMIALLAVLQTQAIPAANEEVEFNHNQKVQSDLVQFKEAASRTIATGTTESTQLQMGATYPSRLLFFNPHNPGGTIRTTGSGEARIQNIESPNSDVNGHIGSDKQIDGLETKRLEYQPNYNEYKSAPTTVMEYGALYSYFEGQEKVLVNDEPDVVNGNTIDLTFFGGDLSKTSSRPLALESRPLSAPARTVSIRPAESNSDNITLTLPTKLSAEEWRTMLSDEPNVVSISDNGPNAIEIELRRTQYQLRMSKIGVGSGIVQPGPEYITRASGQAQTLNPDSAQQLPIEVRDKYNNPVSGVTVNVSVSSGDLNGQGQTATATTDDSGQPMLVYTPDQPGRVVVKASYAHDPEGENFDPSLTTDTKFSIAVAQLVNQNPPAIDDFEKSDWEWDCGTTLKLDLSTNPELSDRSCAFQVEYLVSDSDQNMDTIEVRMIRNGTRTVADTRTIDLRPNNGDRDERRISDGDEIELIDENPNSNSTYDIKIIATDQTNQQGIEEETGIDASDTQTQN